MSHARIRHGTRMNEACYMYGRVTRIYEGWDTEERSLLVGGKALAANFGERTLFFPQRTLFVKSVGRRAR